MNLKICEIFKSVQGESSYVGLPCVFIRLSGCNLRCHYCDSAYAWTDGKEMSLSAIMEKVTNFSCDLALITGGEPLLQTCSVDLAHNLVDHGIKTLVETNGSIDISGLPEQSIRIMDVKCPASGESGHFFWKNLEALRNTDEIKFVITDRFDYEWAKSFIAERLNEFSGEILMSPVFGALEPQNLVAWIMQDNLSVRFQLQLHKVIWGPTMRGV